VNLEHTEGGIGMRVEEPAFLPHFSAGPSQLLFVTGGLVLGLLLPLGGLFAVQQTDPRVRHPSVITEGLGLPVLGIVPHLQTPREANAEARTVFSLGVGFAGTLTVILALSVIGG
jgi:hypothetical protein